MAQAPVFELGHRQSETCQNQGENSTRGDPLLQKFRLVGRRKKKKTRQKRARQRRAAENKYSPLSALSKIKQKREKDARRQKIQLSSELRETPTRDGEIEKKKKDVGVGRRIGCQQASAGIGATRAETCP